MPSSPWDTGKASKDVANVRPRFSDIKLRPGQPGLALPYASYSTELLKDGSGHADFMFCLTVDLL
jgi:hypothetical protein